MEVHVLLTQRKRPVLGFHLSTRTEKDLSTRTEKETRYIQYGQILLFQ